MFNIIKDKEKKILSYIWPNKFETPSFRNISCLHKGKIKVSLLLIFMVSVDL